MSKRARGSAKSSFFSEDLFELTDKQRESRTRKKEKVSDLENRVGQLESENLQLRLQLKVGQESVQRDEQEKLEITQKLDKLIESGATNAEISAILDTYVKKFSDYGAVRSDSIRRHLEQLKRLLVPTQVTKMCMWSLHQVDEFYESACDGVSLRSGYSCAIGIGSGNAVVNPKSVWSILINEIGATADQKEKIKEYRNDARKMAKDLRYTLRECDDLERLIERKNHALGEEVKELQSILQPAQLAKFILWVNKNPASMAMLDSLWNPIDELSKNRAAKKSKTGHT